ncbi:MAG: bifunctional UDP-sugar hydrolase/5'-nucleotidase, partial [Myxococcota bacterium]|nr:bifunctional UDP-sugar hydrolase/5'-nucleotidase [Myxococcota bacterium]
MSWRYSVLAAALIIAPPATSHSNQLTDADTFTILHTNDWQSRLLGFGPNSEYSPETVGDDKTVGGVARLATLLRERREQAEKDGPVLVLDGGDFLMGSLFHTISRETGLELQLLAKLGFDATVIGNHEFDYWPKGLAKTIESAAREAGSIPNILATNMEFSDVSTDDDSLADLMKRGVLSRTAIIERGGLTFGLVGVMGVAAAEVTSTLGPITFDDPVASARAAVMALKAEHNPDVIIALSHSGIVKQPDGSWTGEDIDITNGTPDIDVLVGGHSHTPIFQPILASTGSPVLQAGSECRYLGELKMKRDKDGGWAMVRYELHPVDDQTLGEPTISQKLEEAKALITKQLLAPQDLTFDQPIAKTSQLLTRAYDDTTIGNLVTDATRFIARADIAVTGNGTLRDEIHPGQNGIQSVADLFRVASLGLSLDDDKPGYPIGKFYATGKDLKSLAEVLLIAPSLKGGNFFPRFSGLRIHYNPQRIPLDRIYAIDIGSLKDGYRRVEFTDSTDQLYSVAATTYVAGFTWVIEDLSHGLLSLTPRDASGAPLPSVKESRFDVDPSTPGVQEVKEWEAILSYLKQVPERTADGLADLDSMVSLREERVLTSTSPSTLLTQAGTLMWAAFLSILGVLSF